MHAGVVVVLGRLVELHEAVVPGPDPFGGVDGAGDEVLVDLAARQGDRRGAELRHDVAAETGDAHLESLEVIGGVDLLAEPTPHLHPGVAGHQALEPEVRGELVPQLLAASPPNPGIHLGVGQAEGHCREVGPAGVLALPVVVGRVVSLRIAGRHLVEGVEGLHALARGEVLDLDAPVTHVGEALGKSLGAGPETREVPRPSCPPWLSRRDLLSPRRRPPSPSCLPLLRRLWLSRAPP